MTGDNPYRAAGAFAGKAYIRRGADDELLEQIRDNQYYPYFAAPRQSGKSSLIARSMAALAPEGYRCALVDLSPFVISSYDDFWRQFLHEIARSANFDPAPIGKQDPRDVVIAWLHGFNGRVVVFVDEIDALLHVECREQIFSKIRSFFNLRAYEQALLRLQFVLAGAAHSSRFITDPRWSPFNVAVEISLQDLTLAQVTQLASYLATAGTFAGPELVHRVHELTGGSVYLCQLVFESLWNRAARGKRRLEAADVDDVVETIVTESPRNIHFYNIFRLITQDARLAMLFRRLAAGEALGEVERKELELTGLCNGPVPFRNEVYARVFGESGPLDLKVAASKVALGRKLEAAIALRTRLQEAGEATELVEEEIEALRREFREGAKLREGDVLGRGRFKLIERAGQGGFATVWRARDEHAARDVAIKVLHGQFADDKSRRERFFRGAWKMSELHHPGVVEVVEPYGEEGGRHFFVMEYMPGGTLHDAVLDRKISHNAVVAAIVAVAHALTHAHQRSLVHRDVKPSNVLLGPGGAKLTDFDLVREQDISGSTRTGPMGSFIYAAPEVMSRPQDADHRADVYGLAMTAVFGLYGAVLPLDVVRDADRFIDRLKCGGLVKDVLKKGVSWELDRRFSSAAEFASALQTAWSEPDGEPAAVVAVAGAAAAVVVAGAAGARVGGTGKHATVDPTTLGAASATRTGGTGRYSTVDAAASGVRPSASARLAVDVAGAAAGARAGTGRQGVVDAPIADDEQAEATPRTTSSSALPQQTARPAEPDRPRRSTPLLAGLGVLASAAIVLFAVWATRPPAVDQDEPRASEGILSARTDPERHVVHDMSPETATRAETRPGDPAADDTHASKASAPSAAGDAPPTTATTGPDEPGATTVEAPDSASPAAEAGEEPKQTTSATSNASGGQAPQVRPPTVDEQIDTACSEVAKGDSRKGVDKLKKLFDLRPKTKKLLSCLAQGHSQLGEYNAAESFYVRLIEEYPRDRTGLLGAGQMNEMMARYERAAIFYERLLNVDGSVKSARLFFKQYPHLRGRASLPTPPPDEGLMDVPMSPKKPR